MVAGCKLASRFTTLSSSRSFVIRYIKTIRVRSFSIKFKIVMYMPSTNTVFSSAWIKTAWLKFHSTNISIRVILFHNIGSNQLVEMIVKSSYEILLSYKSLWTKFNKEGEWYFYKKNCLLFTSFILSLSFKLVILSRKALIYHCSKSIDLHDG